MTDYPVNERADDWEPTSDYDDQMTAIEDGLLSYDDTHCEHGTFVGNAYGPDYMCHWCECGVGVEEHREIMRERARRKTRKYVIDKQSTKVLRQMIAEQKAHGEDTPEMARLGRRLDTLNKWYGRYGR